MTYPQYLKTEYWLKLRIKVIKRDGGRCRRCGSEHFLQIHHEKYRGWYNEKISDLLTLCKDCHHYRHSWLRRLHIVVATLGVGLLFGIIIFTANMK